MGDDRIRLSRWSGCPAEHAAILRNKLQTLEQLRREQSLFSPNSVIRDYVVIAVVGSVACTYVLMEREGKIINHKHFLLSVTEFTDTSDICGDIISYLYGGGGMPIPQEIILGCLPDGQSSLEQFLRQVSGHAVTIRTPQRGDLKKRIDTATDNAKYQLKLEALKKNRREHGLADLANVLQLPHIPKRIEAFDISNLGATNIVGASVVFTDGQPDKKEYRKYKIKTPDGQNDFASMRELVFRRVTQKERPLPDLLLIDGGKGQLSAALDALQLARVNVSIVALAKQEETLFTPTNKTGITLPRDSDALLLLMAIRDEVHRFVISFHRQRRSKTFLGK